MEKRFTTEEISQLRSILTNSLKELFDKLASPGQETSTVELDQPIGRLSRIDALQRQQIAAAMERQTKLGIERINAALLRLETDEYGLCKSCGEDISKKRIFSAPAVLFCIDCQNKREKK